MSEYGGDRFRSLAATLHVPRFDVDVDSNNDSGFLEPDDNREEDRLERDASRGKLVGVGGGRVPLAVRLSANVAEARPASTELYFDYDPTLFQLWKNAGSDRSPGNMIPAKTWVNAAEIGLTPGGRGLVYVEALKGASAPVPLLTQTRITGLIGSWGGIHNYPTGILTDTVHLLPVAVDLDVDSNNDGEIDPDNGLAGKDDRIEEGSPGQIVFANTDDDDRNGVVDVFDAGPVAGENDLVRVLLTVVAPTASFGTIIVTYDESAVRLYRHPDRRGPIASGEAIAAGEVSATGGVFYAEGRAVGTTLVTATYEVHALPNTDAVAADTVRLTVLPYPDTIDVDIDSDNNDDFAPPKRSEWEDFLEDHEYGVGKLIMLDNPQRGVTPIVLEIAAGLPVNSPAVGVLIDWDEVGPAGWVRLWNTSVADASRNPGSVHDGKGGNYIAPDFVCKLADLNYNPQTGTIMIWAEGIRENEQLKTLAGVEAARRVDERIRGTLVVNGDDAAFDEVKYIVANEDSFYHALHTRQEVRNALASRGVYTFADMPQFSLQPKSPLDLRRLGAPDDANLLLGEGSGVGGFKAMLYQDYITGKDQYVLTFGGTDDEGFLSGIIGGEDWWNNFVQGAGYGAPEQYVAAMEVGFALANIPATQGRLIATGHSLGGGLASAAAVVGGFRADTFNAAWLREETLLESDGLGGSRERYQGSLHNFAGTAGTVDAYYIDWDVLTFAQRRASNVMSLHPVGTLLERDGPYDERLVDLNLDYMKELHSMPSVLYGLLVTESSFGRITIDMLGYNAYFGN
jgi:hypothetical protein